MLINLNECKRDEIANFILYWTSDEAERERMNKVLDNYIEEDHTPPLALNAIHKILYAVCDTNPSSEIGDRDIVGEYLERLVYCFDNTRKVVIMPTEEFVDQPIEIVKVLVPKEKSEELERQIGDRDGGMFLEAYQTGQLDKISTDCFWAIGLNEPLESVVDLYLQKKAELIQKFMQENHSEDYKFELQWASIVEVYQTLFKVLKSYLDLHDGVCVKFHQCMARDQKQSALQILSNLTEEYYAKNK